MQTKLTLIKAPHKFPSLEKFLETSVTFCADQNRCHRLSGIDVNIHMKVSINTVVDDKTDLTRLIVVYGNQGKVGKDKI